MSEEERKDRSNAAATLGRIKSPARAAASRANGRKGGPAAIRAQGYAAGWRDAMEKAGEMVPELAELLRKTEPTKR